MASGSFGRNFGGGRGGRSDAMHRPPISQEYNVRSEVLSFAYLYTTTY